MNPKKEPLWSLRVWYLHGYDIRYPEILLPFFVIKALNFLLAPLAIMLPTATSHFLLLCVQECRKRINPKP